MKTIVATLRVTNTGFFQLNWVFRTDIDVVSPFFVCYILLFLRVIFTGNRVRWWS